jgi:hypothetical protein
VEQETIRLMCPNVVCKRVLAVPLAARGRTVRCRFCGMSIRVPLKKEPAKAAPTEGEDGESQGKTGEAA